MSDYNGWKNRATWNVSLWINNDEPLYRNAVEFMKAYKGRKPYKDFVLSNLPSGDVTPDGYMYFGSNLDYNALNSMMKELI